MKKSLLTVGLAVISMNVLGMNYSEQSERRSSVNMVSISEPSEKNETLTINSGITTWWSDGLRNGKEGFLKIVKEKRKKCKSREKKIKAFNSKNSNGRNILMYAAENADVKIMTLLLDMNVIDLDSKDNDGNTALLIASETGDIEKIRLLLSRGADVNAINNDGQTSLSIIATSGKISQNKEILRLLFKYGANLDSLRNFENIDALKSIQEKVEKERYELTRIVSSPCSRSSNAFEQQKSALEEWGEINAPGSELNGTELIEQVGTYSIWSYALIRQNIDFIRYILKNYPNVDFSKQAMGRWTPLILAIEIRNKDIINILLEIEQLDVDVQCDKTTALTRAITYLVEIKEDAEFNDWKKIIFKIIKKSKNIDLLDGCDETALMKLMKRVDNNISKYKEIMLELIRNSKNVDVQNEVGTNALMIAIQNIVNEKRKFISKSPNIDVQNDVITTQNNDVISVFMFNMNPNTAEKNVPSLLKIKHWEDIVFELINTSQNVDLENINGHTSLHIAMSGGLDNIVQKLREKSKEGLQKGLATKLYAAYAGKSESIRPILEKCGTIPVSVLTEKAYESNSFFDLIKKDIGTMRLILSHLKDKDQKKESEFRNIINQEIESRLNDFEEAMEQLDSKYRAYLEEQQEKKAEREKNSILQERLNQKWLEGDNKGDQKTEAESSSFKNAAKNNNWNQVQNLLCLKNEKGERLISQDTINEGFLLAAENGSKESIESLLNEVDINHKDLKTRNTALMLAAQNGHLTLVGDLVANGATIDVNNNGYTALRFAAENGHADVVEYLLDAEARTKYLNEMLSKVKEKIAQNDSLIENYKKIQEMLNERQQDDSTSPDSSESEEEIKTWSVYFWNNASKDYGSLDENRKKETDRLLSEIQKNPFERRTTPGQKPEPLYGNLSGFFSRRINGEDRLVYRVKGDCIHVVACNDHYEDLYNLSKSEIRSLSSFNNEWKNDTLIKF